MNYQYPKNHPILLKTDTAYPTPERSHSRLSFYKDNSLAYHGGGLRR